MPSMKLSSTPGGDESDGDMSAGDSDRSNMSEIDNVRDSSDEEADSDDSSEMDEGECEQRRNECMDNLTDLERQFSLLREQLYRERIAQVDHQLAEVKGGRSQEYLIPLQQLQDDMRIRTEVASILRQLRLANIRNKYDAEEQAARQNLESEKALAWDYYYEELIETIKRLEEDRHNVEISWGEGGEWSTRSRSRSRRKAVTVSGPYIVYMLKPQDIMEDWTTIRKALKRST
ncbi:breast cancer metastasis-suppressor 1 [Holotrichia oblita]|uniref:Breast cancer metastasis-suppressor 1 n=1 Tax=Holotrichia oblita TaxID=644536 RepID=A0ACB9TBG4_HOLOL|nr:breast cancer metastasis-suppressor 1 [Holotrichia oblita]